jgi:hypothetical protein
MSEVANATAESTNTAEATSATVTPAVETPKVEAKAEVKDASVIEKTSAEKPPEGQPAVIKYELKIPEGSQLDPKHVEKVEAYAKSKNLSQEQAQEILQREHEAVSSFSETLKAKVEEEKNSWQKAVQADKEIGGEKFNESIELAKRAYQKFAPPEFTQLLNESGYGNHPLLVKTFFRIGKAMGEDKLVVPGAQGVAKRDPAEVLYGKTTINKE